MECVCVCGGNPRILRLPMSVIPMSSIFIMFIFVLWCIAKWLLLSESTCSNKITLLCVYDFGNVRELESARDFLSFMFVGCSMLTEVVVFLNFSHWQLMEAFFRCEEFFFNLEHSLYSLYNVYITLLLNS